MLYFVQHNIYNYTRNMFVFSLYLACIIHVLYMYYTSIIHVLYMRGKKSNNFLCMIQDPHLIDYVTFQTSVIPCGQWYAIEMYGETWFMANKW